LNGSRILIIEDEPALLRGLEDLFRGRGCEVLAAADGQKGLDLALSGAPDLILLDIMLPEVNGFEVCRAVREGGLEMPILMLTAKGQEEDIVLGLNLGADDYITKPFKMRELVARVNAFLRRRKSAETHVFRFGEFELNMTAHRLYQHGKEVELTAKEFGLLAHLVTHPGRAFSRESILNAVWGNSVIVTERSVYRCITTLRAKLETDPHRPTYIATVRDIGYRFDGEIG